MRILRFIFVFLIIVPEISSQTYDEYIEYSINFLEHNDLSAAEEMLNEAMKKEPANSKNSFLLFTLGNIQQQSGKPEEALLSYTAALGRDPDNITYLSYRASLFTELNRPEDAIIDFSLLLETDPGNEFALFKRGMLYLQVQQHDFAEKDFQRLLDLNPNTLDGRIGFASLYKLRKEYDEAEKVYYFLIEKVPGNANLFLGRAEVYLLQGKAGKAMNDINKALSIDPGLTDIPYLYMLRARTRLLQYEKISARKDIEKAVELGYDKEEAASLLELCK